MDNGYREQRTNRSGGKHPSTYTSEASGKWRLSPDEIGQDVRDRWLIIWGDGHWTTAPTARRLLREIGRMQYPPMNVKEVKSALVRRHLILTGEPIQVPRRSTEFIHLMARVGMFRLYVA